MLLIEPQETRLDLRFRAFGFPVRVSPWFWVGAVLLSGADDVGTQQGAAKLLIWVGVVFVSILLHELGHAVMFRRYGRRAHVVLTGFGGLAVPDGSVGGPWRQIKVSLAGPAVNFLIAGLTWATNLQYQWADRHEYLDDAYWYLYQANLGWGMLNLLPIWPLDGGQVCRQVCRLARSRQPEATSLRISIGTALLLVVLGLLAHTGQLMKVLQPVLNALPTWFPAHLFVRLIPTRFWILFFVLLAYESYELLRAIRRASYGGYADDYGDKYPWQR